jgi:penicillin amidase
VKSWRVPTWSLVFADVDGHIGYQCVGRIPIRNNWTRGYRPGWDPAHSWQGLVPFEGMPALADPPRGWIGTANNRTAPEDFPYPLSGTWSSGYRARRIREMLEGQERFSREEFARMHVDVLSRRAVAAVPKLLEVLGTLEDEMSRQAIDHLQQWDCRMEPDRVGATIFETFFHRWCAAVAAERFSSDLAELAAGAIGGLALNLLSGDDVGWFTRSERLASIRDVFLANLSVLSKRLGPDMDRWQWGRLHTLTLRHPLSARGELAALLDRGNEPVGGNGVTVCNTMYNPDFSVATGANYRLISDLSESPPGMWAVDAAGQSGHPGSPHYCDQLREWVAGRYHLLPLDREVAVAGAIAQLVIQPRRVDEA